MVANTKKATTRAEIDATVEADIQSRDCSLYNGTSGGKWLGGPRVRGAVSRWEPLPPFLNK